MAENYKHLYEQMQKLVEQYQDKIVPGLWKQIEDLERNREEVVRCKDCKYLRRRRKNEHYVFCGNPVNGLWRIWSGDSFCSYGERRAE